MLKVLITGGANGIGREIAMTFALSGFEVMITDKDTSGGLECVESIISIGGKASFFHADVSVPSDISELFKYIKNRFESLNILINNAGYGIWKSPEVLSVDEWDSVINTNLRGAFLCSKGAAEIMRISGSGSIINIASTRAYMSEPDSEAYAASKGGLIALTHALAASYAKDNIRVNCISPGWIETGDYKKLRKVDHAQHFSGRVGKPSDIAKACLFLSENDFVNGENIIIDGGMTRKMIYEP